MKFYLRVEAVNLSNFISDTEDLATIRGASLVLLDMVDKLTIKQYPEKLKTISTGASAGLYEFEADALDQADSFRTTIETAIKQDLCAMHATFVVDVIAQSNDFSSDRERLIALNRWRQMRQPTIAVPTQNQLDRRNDDVESRYTACTTDHVRPGTQPMEEAGGRVDLVSASVKPRREYGRTQRQRFYAEKTGLTHSSFTTDFEELTAEDSSTGNIGNLDLKMAVIYVDGNKFGERQSKCQQPNELIKWDRSIQTKRNLVLKALLQKALDPEAGKAWRRASGAVRLETLLWGGDDLIWVVPAWKGFETLQRFFTFQQNPNQVFWEFDGTALTHAAGIVFCHRNAPIYRIRRLAEELAGLAKGKSRDQNLVAYEVLESFDHAGTDIGTHRHRWFPKDPDPATRAKELILNGDELSKVAGPMSFLKQTFPRRQSHRIVQALLRSPEEAKGIAEGVIANLDEKTQNQLQLLGPCFGTSMTRWIHFAELWDYI